jgi:D-alanyl-lipoteichoic acid acyltransferase DltB (MBOAT superfamily)
MAFLSVDFFLLLPFAVLLFHLAPLSWRRPLLLLYSYGFYATWSVPYAGLLLLTTLIIRDLALRMQGARSDGRKRLLLTLGLVALTLMLGLFKYAPAAGGAFASLLVPLGISYYTFKLISYLVDVYWDKLPAERDLVSLLLFPVFFPQILSGPIQRAKDFLPQIAQPAPVPAAVIASGLRLILFGLFKKLVIADRLALMVGRVFDAPEAYSSLGLLLAAYGFAVQVYADFSGVTDLAIGIGRLFGIDSPQNFNSPYYAPNIQEFWRRWHMSLSGWLTDYIFTPLRLAFRDFGNLGLVLAITVNMVAIGVWHGPRLTYVVFGLVNAFYMVVSALTLKARNRFYKSRPRLQALRAVAAPVFTFHMVVFVFLLMRANSVSDFVYIVTHAIPRDLGPSLSLRGLSLSFNEIYWAALALPIMEAIHLLKRRGTLDRVVFALPTPVRWAGYYALILATALFGVLEVREFFYAQF